MIVFFYSRGSLAYTPKEGNLTSYFGPYVYKTNFAGSKSGVHSPDFAGVGLVVNGDISPSGSLEIGLFQINKVYIREDLGKYIAVQTALIHITMGYRRWFNEYISASLSFFSAYSLGSPKIIHSDFAPGSEIDTSAKDTTEYGFDIAVQAEIYSQLAYAIVLDARYAASVTSKKNENADHYGIMLGLRYFFQEKSKKVLTNE